MSAELEERLSREAASLRCFEPAGSSVCMSWKDVFGHSLVLGATGSGKTSCVVYPLIQELLTGTESVGLLIVDMKADQDLSDLLENVTDDPFGRSTLVVVDKHSHTWLDPFASMRNRGINGIDDVVAMICAGVPIVESNSYWHTIFFRLVRHCLLVLQLSSPSFSTKEAIDLLAAQLLAGQAASEMDERLAKIEESKDKECMEFFGDLEATQAMWDRLDSRTKSNLQSMANTVVDPLRVGYSKGYFNGHANESIDIGTTIDRGNVLLVRIQSTLDPELAQLVGKMVKTAFYTHVMKRQGQATEWQTPCGLILDEWALSISGGSDPRSSDIHALQAIRSKGGCLIASIQSVAAMDMAIGQMQRSAALANFNNVFCFRLRDEIGESFVWRTLGLKTLRNPAIDLGFNRGRRGRPLNLRGDVKVPILEPGQLAKLETGQAFVVVGSEAREQPVWFTPYYEAF